MRIRYDSIFRYLRYPVFYFIRWLTCRVMNYCEKRGKIFKITGTGGPEDVYLIRYYVFKSKRFNVFIHQFLRSDRDDLHDHPWNFCTYLVDGAYKEYKFNQVTGKTELTVRHNSVHCRNFGDPHLQKISWSPFIFRKAEDQHKVVVYNEYKERQKRFAPLTICITGPAIREWGFVKEIKRFAGDLNDPNLSVTWTERKWIEWRQYLGLPPSTPGRG